MRYQVMELGFPRLRHGETDDDRFAEVPGRIASVIADHGGGDKVRTLTVLVELEESPAEAARRARQSVLDLRKALEDARDGT